MASSGTDRVPKGIWGVWDRVATPSPTPGSVVPSPEVLVHRSFVRRGVVAAAVLLAMAGLTAPARAADLPAWSATGDSIGDVTDGAGIGNVIAETRADLSYASATYRPDRIF